MLQYARTYRRALLLNRHKLVLAGVTVSGEDVGVVVHAATGDAVVTITGLATCPMIEYRG